MDAHHADRGAHRTGSVMQLALVAPEGYWRKVAHSDVRARLLADRHYSRQTIGAVDFMASGRKLVLLTHDECAVWGAIENLDPAGNRRWRCSIFRNEGADLSSTLIREATERTHGYWRQHYHGLPAAPLTTEVNPALVHHKRDPGRCFRKAGWSVIGEKRGLIVLRAPPS